VKGITNFEFVLSLFVFLSTISFVSLTIVNRIPNLHEDSIGDEIKVQSFVVSELLLFDQGDPAQWSNETVRRLGFSNGTRYVIDQKKLDNFSIVCERDRQALIDALGYVIVNITTLDDGPVMYCKTVAPLIEFKIRRFAVLTDGSSERVVKMEVTAG